MSQLRLVYIDVRFCAHATEDVKKVLEAVSNVFSNEVDYKIFKKSNLEGHYGNPITFFEARIKNQELIRIFLEKISSSLSSLDKEKLNENIDSYFEKGSLYIRLDKQAAYQGNLKLETSDPIRIRIRFRKSKIEEVTKILREIGLLS